MDKWRSYWGNNREPLFFERSKAAAQEDSMTVDLGESHSLKQALKDMGPFGDPVFKVRLARFVELVREKVDAMPVKPNVFCHIINVFNNADHFGSEKCKFPNRSVAG